MKKNAYCMYHNCDFVKKHKVQNIEDKLNHLKISCLSLAIVRFSLLMCLFFNENIGFSIVSQRILNITSRNQSIFHV